jgi:hypothetical protein
MAANPGDASAQSVQARRRRHSPIAADALAGQGVTEQLLLILEMLHELRKVFAFQGAFRDRIPNRPGFFCRDLVIDGSQVKDQIIGIRDLPALRCPPKDGERLQIGIQGEAYPAVPGGPRCGMRA